MSALIVIIALLLLFVAVASFFAGNRRVGIITVILLIAIFMIWIAPRIMGRFTEVSVLGNEIIKEQEAILKSLE